MIFRPLQPQHRPLLYWSAIENELMSAHQGDIAIDARDLTRHQFNQDILSLLSGKGKNKVFVWLPAFLHPSAATVEKWQKQGFDGVLLADFDVDGFRMLLIPDDFFMGIVFIENFAKQPDRIRLAAKVLEEQYGRSLYFLIDHHDPQRCEALTHVKANS